MRCGIPHGWANTSFAAQTFCPIGNILRRLAACEHPATLPQLTSFWEHPYTLGAPATLSSAAWEHTHTPSTSSHARPGVAAG
jgi:hypothetical protein